MTLNELADLRFFSHGFVESLEDKKEALDDHNCFVLFALELFGKEKHENFLEYIDFKNGIIKEEIKDVIKDDCLELIKVVKICFHDK